MPAPFGDFVTTRGEVPYSMAVDGLHEDYPSDGSPRTFYAVGRVRADLAKAFREAMLPDVDDANTEPVTGASLTVDAFDTNNTAPTYQRMALNRKLPEQHPEHPNAWCSRITFLRGEGVPVHSDTHWMTYLRDNSGSLDPGFVSFGVTWQDLPYTVTVGNTKTLSNGRTVPDEDADNLEINSFDRSELERYCWVRPMSKTTALQVRGNYFYYLTDEGTLLLNASGNPLSILGDNSAPTIPFGFTGLQATWYMIPRVPLGAWRLRNMVNQLANIHFDANVIPEGADPEIGTLLYIGPDGPPKPYFTVTDQVVYDLTLNFLYRRGARGPNEIARGQNAVFCPAVRAFRRVIAATLTGNAINTHPTTGDPDLANLPSDGNVLVSGSNPGHNIYDYGDLLNIWRFQQ